MSSTAHSVHPRRWGDPAGADPARARELAILLVGAIEGGFLLSRAARSPEPMLALGRAVTAEVARSLPTPT